MDSIGFYFKRVLSDDERNAFERMLARHYGVTGCWPEPTGEVDVEALLREAARVDYVAGEETFMREIGPYQK